MNAVGAIDVGAARRPEHDGIARRAPAKRVRRRIGVVIGLDLDDLAADPVKEKRCANEVGRDRMDAAREEAAAQDGHRAISTATLRHARTCSGHPRLLFRRQDVDGRVKPGHDAES